MASRFDYFTSLQALVHCAICHTDMIPSAFCSLTNCTTSNFASPFLPPFPNITYKKVIFHTQQQYFYWWCVCTVGNAWNVPDRQMQLQRNCKRMKKSGIWYCDWRLWAPFRVWQKLFGRKANKLCSSSSTCPFPLLRIFSRIKHEIPLLHAKWPSLIKPSDKYRRRTLT